MEIEFSGSYSRDVYSSAIRWIYRPSNRSLLLRFLTFVVFTALYVATIVNAFQKGGASPFELTRIFRHLITFFIFAYIVVQPYIGSWRKTSELWNDPLTRRKLTGRVSTIGVIIDPMKDWMPWDRFDKVNRTPEAITLLTSSKMFVLLQRDFFKSEQDWKRVQDIVNSRVQEVIE
ncbi:MAG: hypothetical protein HY865_08945 [Chloroflexi bacterium]|nr:hypothetical protein [Chloroflexota bacterium]